MEETIAAIATPFGEGAISLIRLSGPEAVNVFERICRAREPLAQWPPRTARLARVVDAQGRVVDEVLATRFSAPASYTGEAMVEITGHGGILVTRRVLGLLLENGARLAHGGEFTRRAFLNGKMDLTQAEAVMDLIRAQTDLALRAATEQLEGRLGERVRGIQDALLDLLAHIEAYIDFPEEDIDPETGATLLRRLGEAQEQVAGLLQTADQGKILREGVRTVIYGAPNVGKSSLLNRLLGVERAIVSDRPGTTRDAIEEVINLRGIPLRLVDTAGVRESDDELEQAGITRTLRHLERADLVLHLHDASLPPPADPVPPAHLLILNKIDLGEHPDWAGHPAAVRLSCHEGTGLDALGEAIFTRAMGGGPASGDFSVAINARHLACLKSAREALEAVRAGMEAGLSPEFVAVDLRAALDATGDIIGRLDTEDLLGRIFSTFCLGK